MNAKPRIDIISHCYAAKLPQYAQFLRVQARSLADHKPLECLTTLFIACASKDEDPATHDAISEAAGLGVKIAPMVMPLAHLFRRAIARHAISQWSKADVLWYCDVDYAFGPGCLDTVAAQVQKTSPLCYPQEYFIHRDHCTGEAEIARLLAGGEPSIRSDQYMLRWNHLCLGGLQIIGQEEAKRVGYLGGTKWQQPLQDISQPFPCFFDDTRWRRDNFPGGAKALHLPNLYRLRHEHGTVTPSKASGRRPKSKAI